MKIKNNAFTLVELLVVIAIIGILASVLVYATGSARQKSRDNKRITDIRQIQVALDAYYSNNNSYPLAITPGQAIADANNVYMVAMPANPHPDTDGGCASGTEYSYSYVSSNLYLLSYCMGSAVSNVAQGTGCATAGNISAVPGSLGAYPGNTGGASTQPECSPCVCGDCSALNCDGLSNYASSTASCTVGSVTYKAVKEDTQCWLDKNINLGVMETTYTDHMTDNTTIEKWCGCGSGGTCTVPVPSYCDTYGALYNWSEMMYLPSACNVSITNTCAPAAYLSGSGISAKRQGICPKGWHIPSDYEWETLEHFLDATIPTPNTPDVCANTANGFYADNICALYPAADKGYRGTDVIAKLKSAGISNLNLPAAGERQGSTSNFTNRGYLFYWTSTQSAVGGVWNYSGSTDRSYRDFSSKTNQGFSVRCLKD